jgi:hypothetical protein
LLDNKSLIQTNVTGRIDRGDLSDPYKEIYSTTLARLGVISEDTNRPISPTTPGGGGTRGLFHENRPDMRRGIAWLIKYQRHFPTIRSTAHIGYRLYRDSWDILAHTFEGQTFHELPGGFVLSPMVRFYRQNAADFYALVHGDVAASVSPYPDPAYPTLRLGRLDGHASSDSRLSKFSSTSFGLEIGKTFGDNVKASVGYQRYVKNEKNKPDIVAHVPTFTDRYAYRELRANLITASIDILL